MEEIKQIKCAIYTRKSTTEGADQDFTSLDAQRESAESYIASQKHQGWIALAQKYDDYGFTGANTERPALQQLLSDIKENKINCVIVYKVDRLSRSLLDFTNLLSLFEKYNVTFVSVTQHFNTQNSMGRLTLNILLSFAQFEREIISERTSDKMGAARKKGKFVGGRPALGYDLDTTTHRLSVNAKEAEVVKRIFNLYIREESILAVADALKYEGYRTKQYLRKGRTSGGVDFKTTNLHHILRNVIYIGKVSYRGELFKGEHEPIIAEDIFNMAQELLRKNRRIPKRPSKKNSSILSQIFRCKACNSAIIYTYTKKSKYHYHFYVCANANKAGYHNCPTKILNAQRTENAILDCLRKISASYQFTPDTWGQLTTEEKIDAVRSTVDLIEYDALKETVEITPKDGTKHVFSINLKADKNSNKKLKAEDLPPVLRYLLLAYQIQQFLDDGTAKDLNQIAKWTYLSLPRIYQIMNLLALAPKIQEYLLLSNDQRLFYIPENKIRPLLKESDWSEQSEMFINLLSH